MTAGDRNDPESQRSVNLGPQNSRSGICACFCCDRFEGTRSTGGTFIPTLSGNDGAPSRSMPEQEWAAAFDQAVTNLAQVASNFRAHPPPNDSS